MSKKISLEKSDPVTAAQAQEIVLKVKRSLLKKFSVTKISTELIPHLQNLKKEGK